MTDIKGLRYVHQDVKKLVFGDGQWVFFELGKFAKPKIIINDYTLSAILRYEGFLIMPQGQIEEMRDKTYEEYMKDSNPSKGQWYMAMIEAYCKVLNDSASEYVIRKEKEEKK